MKLTRSVICAVLVIGVSSPALRAQQKPASMGDPVSQAIRDTWEGAKRNIKESADQMSDADYSFKPTDSVRTFGQILAHLAGASYVVPLLGAR